MADVLRNLLGGLMRAEKAIRNKLDTALPGSREAGEALEMINRLPDGELKSDLLTQYPTVLQRNLHVRQQLLEFERNPTAETQDRDPFGDGDQSPLEGRRAENLRAMWAEGMDWHPARLDDFNQACFLGSMHGVRTVWDETPQADRWKLLERRFSRMRFCALHNVISGAVRASITTSRGEAVEPEHLAVATFLCQRGANLNAKDVIGHTPLHHATSVSSTPTCHKIAQVLLNFGADINAQNRLGSTALFEPVQTRNMKLVRMLLDKGADASLKDNEGHQVLEWALLEMRSLISNSLGARARRRALEGFCRVCDDRKSTMACGQCGSVSYCSRVCQKQDWKTHKKTCRAPGEEIEVLVDLQSMRGDPMVGGSIANAETGRQYKIGTRFDQLKAPGVKFPIKAQVPEFGGSVANCLVYDEPLRAIVRCLTPSHNVNVDCLIDMVKTYGIAGKMHFPAYVDEQKRLHIILRDAHADALVECRRMIRARTAAAASGGGGGSVESLATELQRGMQLMADSERSGASGGGGGGQEEEGPSGEAKKKSKSSKKKKKRAKQQARAQQQNQQQQAQGEDEEEGDEEDGADATAVTTAQSGGGLALEGASGGSSRSSAPEPVQGEVVVEEGDSVVPQRPASAQDEQQNHQGGGEAGATGGAAAGAAGSSSQAWGDDDEGEECCICFKSLATDVLVTECNHAFHRACLVVWKAACLSRANMFHCPYCRDERLARLSL